MLFHGPGGGNVVSSICTNNFDPKLYRENRSQNGRGSYFAKNANYSHKYGAKTEPRYMFLANVLVGRYAKGNDKMARPPPLPEDEATYKHELYDSTVDNVDDPQCYVIYDKEKCYPNYLIRYKEI